MAQFLEDMSPEDKRAYIRRMGGTSEQLLSVLLGLQRMSRRNFIDEETALLVAEELHTSEARIYDVLTFYDMLSTTPGARFVLEVCNSTPCHYEGSAKVVEVLKQELGVEMDEITPDGLFSYTYCPCLGACDIGPVIRVKDNVYGYLNEARIQRLLDGLRRRAAREDAGAGRGECGK